MEDAFIILFGLTVLYIATTGRLFAHVKTLALQGILLFLICYLVADKSHLFNFIFLVFETLVVKAIVIPIFLTKIINKTHAFRDTEANISHFYCLFFSSLIVFAGFLVSNIDSAAFKMIDATYFGVSIAVIIVSLLLITVKKKVITSIIGFISMENGIFLLSLSVAKEMPMIVSLGVLLDLFIAIFILGLLANKINKTFDDLEVSQLSNLKDYE